MLLNRIKKLAHGPSEHAFYCNALQGNSTYNICINCDMTVSCNCQDFDGSGHIGNLRTHSFVEIFRSGKVQQFREKLARGEYAIPVCSHCSELRKVAKNEGDQYLKGYDLPKALMIENSILCNLSCRFCDRMVQKIRSQKRMSLEDIELVARLIHDLGIVDVSYHNLGEPFFSDTFPQEISILKKHNPELRLWMSTNGVMADTVEKVRAAVEFQHIYFSIAGPSQEILVKYQQRGNFDKAFNNMRRVVEERNRQGRTRPIVEWKYVVFRWNDKVDHINKAIELARVAGVDLISFMYGDASRLHSSWRYKHSAFFKKLGEPSWRGREIWLKHPQGVGNNEEKS